MKLRLTLLLWGILASLSLFAQYTPQGFNYQSIVRDASGGPILNQPVTLIFTVRSGAPNGPVAYSEKQVASTNEFGLVNLQIGRGNPLQGTFSDINWGGGAKFLTVSVETSPNTFDDLGSSELLSVPYAIYAQSAGTGGGGGNGDNWGAQTVQTSTALSGSGTGGSPLGIAQQGATTGQVLKWNGSEWKPSDDIISTGTNGGTVTQVNTGTGLTGGPINTSGTISLANSGVVAGIYGSATQIPVITVDAHGRVTSVFTVVPQPGTVGIAGGTGINVQQSGLNFTVTNTGDTDPTNDLTNTTVFNGDVTGTATDLQIKPNAVGSPEMADDAVTTAKIANNAVTNAKIVDNAVGTNKVANNAVTTAKIADNAVNTAKIANGSITAAKLDNMGAANGQVLKWDGSAWSPQSDELGSINLSGGSGISVSGTAPDLTITNTGDLDGSDDVLNTTNAGGDLSGTFSTLQIRANVVGTTEIANNAVTNAKLANESVTAAKLDDMGATNGQILKWNGTAWAPAADALGISTLANGTGINVTTVGGTATVTNTGDTNAADDLTNTSTAGGDVQGTFSDLQIRANAVGSPEVANGAITAAKLDDMGATNGQILKWNGATWVPAADEVGGGGGATNVSAGTGINVTTTGNNVTVTNTGDTNAADDLTTSTAYDGDVSGVYNNLQIKANAVNTTEMANGSVTRAKLNNMGAVTGQVLKWTGIEWAPSADEIATGGSTNVVAGTGINVTTAANTVTVINTGDTNAADDVTTTTTHDGDVSGTYNNLQIKANAVGTPEIADNAIATAKIANGAITAAKLGNMGAVNGQILKWNGSAWIPAADETSTGAAVNVVAGTGINVATSGNTVTVANTGDTNAADDVTTTTAHDGDVSGTYNNLQIKANAVGTPEIADNAIATAKIADNALVTAKIANGAITAAKLGNMGAVNGQILKWNGSAWTPAADETGTGTAVNVVAGTGINVATAGNTVTVVNTGDTNAADDVTTTTAHDGDVSGIYNNLQIKANAVGTPEIADNAVATAKIADNAVATAKIANGAITAAKLGNMGAVNGQILKWNGSAWAPAADEAGTSTSVNVVAGTGINVATSGNTVTVINTGDTDAGDDLTQTTAHNGDVTGPFNDLQLKADVVTSNELASNAVTSDNIITGAVTGAKINNMGAATGQVLKWNGTTWAPADDNAGSATGDNWGTQTVVIGSGLGGNGTNGSPLALAQQGAVNGQVLKWNGAAWLPANDGGDNWGTQNVVVGTTLVGTGIAANPLEISQQGAANGQVLKWNGSSWMPANDLGDNWGTQNVVVGAPFIGNGTASSPLNLAQQGAASGQVLKWNGSAWMPANDEVGSGGGGGTGNNYNAGTGITITGTAPNFTINNIGDTDNNPNNEIQQLSLTSGTLSLSNGGGSVVLPGAISYTEGTGIDITGTSPNLTISNTGDLSNTNELQTLSLNGSQLNLSNGGGSVTLPTASSYTGGAGINVTGAAPSFTIVNTGDLSTTNELQSLTLNGAQLSLSNGGGTVTLPGANTYAAGTGISITGTAPNLTIANTGDVSNTNEIQTISLTGAQLSLSNGGGAVTLPSAITYVGGTGISITGSGNTRTVANTGDPSSTNEIQTLSLAGSQLSLSNGGGSVTLPTGTTYTAGTGINIAGNAISNAGDLSNTNEIQTLSVTGDQLSLSNGGGTVTLPTGTTYTAGTGISITGNAIANTGDVSNTNELQNLSLTGTTLTISGTGSSVDLAGLAGGGGGLWAPSGTNINSTNSGNVGIGTSAPAAKLEVVGDAVISSDKADIQLSVINNNNDYARIALGNKNSLNAGWYLLGRSGSGNKDFAIERFGRGFSPSSGAARVLTIDSAQNIQWGTSAAPTRRMLLKHNKTGFGMVLDNVDGVNRTWEFWVNSDNGNLILFNSAVGASIPAGTFALNGVYTPSDRRMKKDIHTLEGAIMPKLMQLQPMSYRYKSQRDNDTPTIGFMAQDLQAVFPELVQTQQERFGTEQYLSVNYAGLGVLAVKAVQEQQSEIDALKKENDLLRQRLEAIEKKIKN